jgi:hypothetical protein
MDRTTVQLRVQTSVTKVFAEARERQDVLQTEVQLGTNPHCNLEVNLAFFKATLAPSIFSPRIRLC